MDPYLAEIRIFAGTFAPVSWAFCQGQMMSIAQNNALFSLVGTTYGGDGMNTFGIPDFRGRIAVGTGAGPGLSVQDLGEISGSESVTLIASNMPAHTHVASATVTPFCNSGNGGPGSPVGAYLSTAPDDFFSGAADVAMGNSTFSVNLVTAGGSKPHSNMMPYLALNFIIATEGVYPSRG